MTARWKGKRAVCVACHTQMIPTDNRYHPTCDPNDPNGVYTVRVGRPA